MRLAKTRAFHGWLEVVNKGLFIKRNVDKADFFKARQGLRSKYNLWLQVRRLIMKYKTIYTYFNLEMARSCLE